MLKMASEIFIHALLLFLGLFSQNFPLGAPWLLYLGLFLKISRWVPIVQAG